ncbi:MAG TPA: glycosyl hydrolase family 18 protein [Ohtaekwangia sp.]|nr:glycosyl hydrolase family 18 protein [Ohtaekwangia sp.]
MLRNTIWIILVIISVNFSSQAQLKVVGYVTNNQLTTVDYSRITHLNIAFENPDDAGYLSYAAVNTSYLQQAHAKGKKVLVSIGGGSASYDADVQLRYFTLINDANRAGFVEKIVSYLNYHGFDGLDVDLEGSAINQDYGKFITALATALKPHNKLLTSALTHANNAASVPNDAMLLFDFINIMAYDATGPWNPDNPGQHSSYDFALESLAYWTNRGLPKQKAVLGVPFYGYGFGEDFNEGISFAQLIARYPGAADRDISGNTIYYNGVATIKQKTEHVLSEGYGGIMIWQLAHDASGEQALLRVIDETLHPVTDMEDEISDSIHLYPNPVDTFLNLKTFGLPRGEYVIIDSSGKEYPTVKKNDLIDMTGLQSGLYIIKIKNEQKVIYRKFIKN